MIHLCRSAKTKEFYVVVLAKNGEVLSTSELLKSKASAWKNIKSQITSITGSAMTRVNVQDDTIQKPCIYLIDAYGFKLKVSVVPVPLYTPSIKSKKK